MIREMEFSYLVEYPDPELHCSKGDTIWPKEKVVPQKKVKKHDWIWPLVWLIGLLILITCLSSCGQEAFAVELTASYYTTKGLKKDGQWAITHGRMANGKLFDDMGSTVASCDYRLGDRLLISRGDKRVMVTVTDRTNKRFKGKRIDLTPAVFKMLSPSGTTDEGLIQVVVEKL